MGLGADFKLLLHEGEKKESLKTLLRVSPRAKALFEQNGWPNIELHSEGGHENIKFLAGSKEQLMVLFEEAEKQGLQLRIEFLIDGFEVRNVEFESLHGVIEEDMQRFIECLELKNGSKVLDMMCGYGAVGQCAFKYAEDRHFSIALSFCDLHETQLKRMKPDVREKAAKIVLGDARQAPFADAYFDAIAIKMGTHDVPQYDQIRIFEESYRMLKPGGILAIWDVMLSDPNTQDAFSDIIRKKDELAGYESFICDRYFFRQDQAYRMFKETGFQHIEKICEVHYRQSTYKRFESEFHRDQSKLDALHHYIRARLTEDLKRQMLYEDHGEDIIFVVPNLILKGKKRQTIS